MIERQSHFVVIGRNALFVPEKKHSSYHCRHVLSLTNIFDLAVDAEEQG